MRSGILPILAAAAAAFAIGVGASGVATPTAAGPEIHYAPEENLEGVDVSLLNKAESRVEIAAYVPTDLPVIEALTDAA